MKVSNEAIGVLICRSERWGQGRVGVLFRGAEPYLFKRRSAMTTPEEGQGKKVRFGLGEFSIARPDSDAVVRTAVLLIFEESLAGY